jgi:hypothetical protein
LGSGDALTRSRWNLNLHVFIIACSATLVKSEAGSALMKKEPLFRFSPLSGVPSGLKESLAAQSFLQLDGKSSSSRDTMACSDSLLAGGTGATITSSSCLLDTNGACNSGPLESVMDGQTNHAWRPATANSGRDYLQYTWAQDVLIRTIQTSGLLSNATPSTAPACGMMGCGAPLHYRVQYQPVAHPDNWIYWNSFSNQLMPAEYTTLNGYARPPQARMQVIAPPVTTKHMRLVFVDGAPNAEPVAVRASIRGCLASETRSGQMTLQGSIVSSADVTIFTNELKGRVKDAVSSAGCTDDQIVISEINRMTSTTTMNITFLPTATGAAGCGPEAGRNALGAAIANTQSELYQWANDVVLQRTDRRVTTCASVDCGHGVCAAGSCFCSTGWTPGGAPDAAGTPRCSVRSTAANVDSSTVTAGNSTRGLATIASLGSGIPLNQVTSNALALQYVDGARPSNEQLDAEMEQVASDLREDMHWDEPGNSGLMMRHGLFITLGAVGVVLTYGIVAVLLVKTGGSGAPAADSLASALPTVPKD